MVEAQYMNLVQMLVPVGAIDGIAASPSARYVRRPFPHSLDAVNGEGVNRVNADAWHLAGTTGDGAKVAVIDFGFAGYTERQASGDLPQTLATQDFCAGDFATSEDHGTAVAEIVHEMAPNAQLFLICINSEVTLGQAKDYAKAQGVHIVNMSASFFNTSRGDGTGAIGSPDAIVSDATASGILWVNSAGNRAQQFWTGTFSDSDSDGSHNFTPTDEGNTLAIPANGVVCVSLKWDSWPVTSEDFDVGLFISSNSQIVAASASEQNGNQPPTEGFCYQNTSGASVFFIGIVKFSANTNPRLDLFVRPQNYSASTLNLQYRSAAGSVTEPGSSPSAFAVGAVCWQDKSLQIYSSQGPTIDGRIKPDIAGPDSVSGATYGGFTVCGGDGFTGTSAASPHVAGAAALVKQANPAFGPTDVRTFLTGRAIDQGSPGADNQTGAGHLNLGAPPATTTATPTPSSTPTPSPTATPTATLTPTVTPTPTGTATAPAADINRDGCVSLVDFNIWLTAFKTGVVPPGTFPDVNNDGAVSLVDFNLWLTAFQDGAGRC
jgi:hypothetical protein